MSSLLSNTCLRQTLFNATRRRLYFRSISTLESNPDIFVHETAPGTYTLSLLSTTPVSARLALGTTTALPPTPRTFTENSSILRILHSVLAKHAQNCPIVQSDALAFAAPAGASIFTAQKRRGAVPARGASGAGAANFQGGAGGGGVGGYLHVYDQRGVPAFGRIAETEDILGSLRVDGEGKVLDGGAWEENRAYRIITGERGLMRLSEYLRGKVVERLKEEEIQMG